MASAPSPGTQAVSMAPTLGERCSPDTSSGPPWICGSVCRAGQALDRHGGCGGLGVHGRMLTLWPVGMDKAPAEQKNWL